MSAEIPKNSFNTQPPEGGWPAIYLVNARGRVSTHSRLKAAGIWRRAITPQGVVSTHSRLKAAGSFLSFG